MKKLTPRQSRLAALGLLALALVLAAALIAVPVWWLNRRYDDALDDATARLARYTRIAGMREGLQGQLAQLRAQGAVPAFLKATSAPLAAAEIQELAKNVVEAQGGKLVSMQILPPKDEQRWRQITVNVQLTASLASLKGILYALEASRPYLFIDNFSARTPPVFLRPGAQTLTEPELTVGFDLTGYALKGAAP